MNWRTFVRPKYAIANDFCYPIEMICEFCSLPENYFSEGRLVKVTKVTSDPEP